MRGRRARARALGLVAVLSAGIASACTAFDDLAPPREKGLPDGSTPESSTLDSGSETASPTTAKLPADGFVTHAEAMNACTIIAACPYLAFSIITSLRVPVAESIVFKSAEQLGLSNRSFSYCVDQLSKTFEPARPGRDVVAATIRKIAAATSCREAGKNLLVDFLADDPRCAAVQDAGGAPGACVDDVTRLECAPTVGLLNHCTAAGGSPSDTCIAIDAGSPPLAGCLLPDGVCPSCEGSILTTCVYEDPTRASTKLPARQRIDCNVLGLECAITPGGLQVGCAMPDHVVREDGYRFAGAYCVNTTVYLSDASYKGYFDCASIGATCVQRTGGALCTMADAECTPFSAGANTCRGSKIHLCVGGRWEDVECPLGCDAPDGSTDSAACRSSLADGG